MYEIVVYLDTNYTNSESFDCPSTWNREQITEEVNKRYDNWWSYDIWPKKENTKK